MFCRTKKHKRFPRGFSPERFLFFLKSGPVQTGRPPPGRWGGWSRRLSASSTHTPGIANGTRELRTGSPRPASAGLFFPVRCCRIDQCTCSQCDCRLCPSYNQIDLFEGWCPGCGSMVVAAKWRAKTICRVAATNLCLAKRNKSRTGAKATNKRSTGEKQ